MTKINVLTWNINVRSRHEETKSRFLDSFDWDVLALQEVRPEAFAYFQDNLNGFGVYRDPAQRGDVANDYGSAVFVREGLHVVGSGLVAAVPFPERAVWADVVLPDGSTMHVLSFHSPNGVGHGGEIKMGAYAAVHEHVRHQRGPTVLACDANYAWDCWPDEDADAWESESLACAGGIWRWHHLLLGPDQFKDPEARTNLRDAWRDELVRDPDRLARMRTIWPSGPTAVTFMNQPRGRVKAHRYDHVYISDHLDVVSMAHHYAEAVAARSDHALVEATLELGGA